MNMESSAPLPVEKLKNCRSNQLLLFAQELDNENKAEARKILDQQRNLLLACIAIIFSILFAQISSRVIHGVQARNTSDECFYTFGTRYIPAISITNRTEILWFAHITTRSTQTIRSFENSTYCPKLTERIRSKTIVVKHSLFKSTEFRDLEAVCIAHILDCKDFRPQSAARFW